MAEVHQLILDMGVDAARTLAFDKLDRQMVDAAFAVLSDESFKINILHSALPHRSSKELIWERIGGRDGEIRLHVESGHLADRTPTGLPFGSIARLILIHLSSEAVKNNSRIVELGPSMNAFLRRMGVSHGGKTVSKRAKDTVVSTGSFIRNAIIPDGAFDDQPSIWNPTVELDEAFFNSLKEHPLPLRESAIKQLSGRSMAMDFYVFLAYRLHSLERPINISWKALYAQFGSGFSVQRYFVREMKAPLQLALSAYPEARVEITETGLVLHPSPSPVPKVFPRYKQTA